MSNVERELNKKRPSASQGHEQHEQYCNKYQRKRTEGQRRPPIEHRELNNAVKDDSNDDGEYDPLLMLALSAELLMESDNNLASSSTNGQNHADEKYKEQRQGATDTIADVGAGESALFVQRKTRLSDIRRQARSIYTQSVPEVHEDHVLGHMGQQKFKAQRHKKQTHIMDVQGEQQKRHLSITAQPRQLEVTDDGGQLSVQKHFIEQPMQMTDEVQFRQQHFIGQPMQTTDELRFRQQHFIGQPMQMTDELRFGQWHFIGQPMQMTDELQFRQHHFIGQPMQMTDELRFGERQFVAHHARLPMSNEQRESKKHHLDLAQQQQRCLSVEQMHALSERQREQPFAIRPQWLQIINNHGSHRDIACEQRLLRTYERRSKRLSESSIWKHGHPKAGEQRSEMYVAEQQLLPSTSLALGGKQVGVDHQGLLRMHGTQTGQIVPGQHRARPIEEQTASQSACKHLPRWDLNEKNIFYGQTPHLHSATANGSSDKLLLEVEHHIHQPASNNSLIDQCVEHPPQETQVPADTEAENNILCVKGKTRLNELRRQARSKSTSVEEKQEGRMYLQNGEGRTCLNQLRRQALSTYTPVEEKREEQKAHQNNEGLKQILIPIFAQ